MKREIDRSLVRRGRDGVNVKLGRGGIREVEFLVQALQLLYGGDDPWLRERNSLRAIFRLIERGYLGHELGRFLGDALVYLRTVEHRLQLLHELQTHTLPTDAEALGRWRAGMGVALPAPAARRRFLADFRRVTGGVHRAFTQFFAHPPTARRRRPRAHSELHRAQGHGLRRSRPGAPQPAPRARRDARSFRIRAPIQRRAPGDLPGAARLALAEPGSRRGADAVRAVRGRRGTPHGLSRAPGRATRRAAEPRAALRARRAPHPAPPDPARAPERAGRSYDVRGAEAPAGASSRLSPVPWRRRLTTSERRDRLRRLKQAEELAITWRMLLGRDRRRGLLGRDDGAGRGRAPDRLAAGPGRGGAGSRGAPRRERAASSTPCSWGSGSSEAASSRPAPDLDMFVIYAGPGETDGSEPVEAHVFYDRAVEALSGPPRRHHRRRHRVPGGPAAAPRLQGLGVRLEPRRDGALLPRMGGSVGAADPDARARRGGHPRARAARCDAGQRGCSTARLRAARSQGDARAPRPHGKGARPRDARVAST